MDYKKLKNGLEIIGFKKNDDSFLKIILVVSMPEKKMKYEGFKHFLEHMAFGGSEKLKSTELNVKSYQLGGIMSAFTGSEFMGFYLEILKRDFNLMLEYLSQIVFHPIYPDKKIAKEKNRIIDEIMGNSTREPGFLTQKYMNILSRGSNYDYWNMGLATHIRKITRDDLLAFHRKYFNAQNTKIFISGNYDESILNAIENRFKNVKKGNKLKEKGLIINKRYSGYNERFYKRNTNQIVTRMVFKLPYFGYSAITNLYLFSYFLGVHFETSENSMFQKEIIGKGLTESIATIPSWINIKKYINAFIITFNSDNMEKYKMIKEKIFDIIEVYKHKKITNGKIQLLKERLSNKYLMDIENPIAFLKKCSRANEYGNINYALNFLDYLKKVTPEKIRDTICKYLNKENVTIVSSIPKNIKKPKSYYGRSDKLLYDNKEILENKIDEKMKNPYKNSIPTKFLRLKENENIIYKIDRTLPLIGIGVLFPFGSANDPNGKEGLVNLLMKSLPGQIKGIKEKEFWDFIDRTGGNFKIEGHKLYSEIIFEFPKKYFKKASELILKLINDISFKNVKYFEMQKTKIIGEIKLRENFAAFRGREILFDKIFGHSSISHFSYGTLKSIKSITFKDIKDYYHKQNIKPSKIMFLGDLPKDFSDTLVKNKNLQFLNTQNIKRYYKNIKPNFKIYHDNGNNTQIQYFLGTFVDLGKISIKKDYPIIEVMNAVLQYHIQIELRYKSGLSHLASTLEWWEKNLSLMLINVGCLRKDLKKVRDKAKEIYKNIILGNISNEDLEIGKKFLVPGKSLPIFDIYAGISGKTSKMLYYLSLGFDIDYINNYMDYINAVSLNDIKRVSKLTINSEKVVEVII